MREDFSKFRIPKNKINRYTEKWVRNLERKIKAFNPVAPHKKKRREKKKESPH